ncbi:MAG TPA: antitoxin Xre/MbcA/ParS toxin-binding domain-containing protein [Balneolaceae bacterium]|nr:antitoxin Xre/MbcA/ParS toxin-binding domain-containing protein [Balneolaceae bacterium]
MAKKNFVQHIIQVPAAAYAATGSRFDLVALSRKGIQKQALLNLGSALDLTLKELSALLPVTERTLQRRNAHSLLSPAVSEQIILITELAARGKEVFGSLEAFKRWLKEENIALAGQPPLSLLDTSIGVQLVTDQLGRIEQGVYA